MRRVAWALALGLAACGDGGEPAAEAGGAAASPERALAARHACVAEELARTAQSDLETLESSLGGAAGGNAVTAFARAYSAHARLRMAAYAQIDSAMNRSSNPADSARHARAAASYSIVPPVPGSLESNVITSYDEKAATILADADHPCNWRHELEAE